MQCRLREDKKTYAFFLDIQKAYDSVWHDCLWYKLWHMGVKGRLWRVIKKMYGCSKSAVLLEGEKLDTFKIEQGVAQGCSLSPILFSVFINDLLKEVEQTGQPIFFVATHSFKKEGKRYTPYRGGPNPPTPSR